jgi:hypothetical protein
MRRCLVVLVACSACGRIGFDARGDAAVGEYDATTLLDVSASGSGCTNGVEYRDDFDGSGSGFGFSTLSSGMTSAGANGGRFVVAFAPSAPAGAMGMASSVSLDLRGGCVTVEPVAVPAPATSAYAFVRVVTATDQVQFRVSGGTLFAEITGSVNASASRAYSVVAHRYLRLRDDGGAVAWQSSADGIAFDVMQSLGTSLGSSSRIELGAGADVPVVNAGGAAYERVVAELR